MKQIQGEKGYIFLSSYLAAWLFSKDWHYFVNTGSVTGACPIKVIV